MNFETNQPIEGETIGSLYEYTEEDTGIVLRCHYGLKRILPYRGGVLRIIIEQLDWNKEPLLSAINLTPAAFMLEDKEDRLCLTTLDLHIVIEKDPLNVIIHDRYEREILNHSTTEYVVNEGGIFCEKAIPKQDEFSIGKATGRAFGKSYFLYTLDNGERKFGFLFRRANVFNRRETESSHIYQLSSTSGVLDYYILTEEALEKTEELIFS